MLVAESLALAAAACIAISGMLIGELKGRVDVMRLARWQMLAAFAMTGGAAVVMGTWDTVELYDLVALTLSSFFGIIIASTTYFAAIYAAGPRMTALLFTLASPFSLFLGYVVLDETIDLTQGLGVALVLVGILLAIGMRRRETIPAVEAPAGAAETAGDIVQITDKPARIIQRVSTLGIVLGVITALGQALGSLFARPAMESGVDPIAAMAVRSGVAALFFLFLGLIPALRKPYRFKRADLGIAVTAAFFGTGLGMSLLMAALATGNVGVVTTLSSMTPIMILPMVWIRSGVAPVREAWIGATIAVLGTALISL